MTVGSFTLHAYTVILTPSNVTYLDSSRPKLKDNTDIFSFDAGMAPLDAFFFLPGFKTELTVGLCSCSMGET